jgi:hypothetical protein
MKWQRRGASLGASFGFDSRPELKIDQRNSCTTSTGGPAPVRTYVWGQAAVGRDGQASTD